MQDQLPYPDIKILLIEDNPGDARLIQELLKEAIDFNHQFYSANNLYDGLVFLEKEDIDVILLDLSLPDSTGYETILRTREKSKNIPIVILTGLDDETVARNAIQAGAQDFLIKGQIDANPLVRSIFHAIDRNKMMHTIESLASTLQLNEGRLRSIIDLNADGIIIVDKEGLVCFVNPTAERLFQKKKKTFIGEYFGFPTKINEKTELEILHNDNQITFAEMNAVEITWESKKAFLISLRDISERKQFEEKIRQSEKKYRDLFENSPFPILIVDINGMIVDSNSSIEQLFGYQKDELLYLPYNKSPLSDGKYFKLLNGTLVQLKEGKLPNPIELKLKKKILTKIWVSLSFSFIEFNEKKHIHVLYKDISEIKRSEQEVRKLGQALHEMNALIEHAPQAILLIHPTGKILRVNDIAMSLFEVEEAQLLNQTIFDLFPSENNAIIIAHYKQNIFDLRSSNKIETTIITSSGKIIEVEITSTILKIADNLIIQSFLSDITERKSSEKHRELLLDQLISSIEFKSQFLAAMSHELRTPLNAILGFTQLLLEKAYGGLNEDQLDFLKDINSAGELLLGLINNVLDFSKMEAGKFELNIQEFYLCEIIKEVSSLLKPLYSKKELSFRIEGIKTTDKIFADHLRFKQILVNLINNAIKFTEKGGVILRIKEDLIRWTLEIEDTGVGIADKDKDVVFREFGRIENDRVREVVGAGLGLALTKRLVALHGGEIWFNSEIGKGTTFIFTIPKNRTS